MPEAIVVSIPARDVPTLRSLALADFSVSAEQIAEARHEDDAALSREMADECAQMLGLLGWDTPVETDSLIPARREFLWGCLRVGLRPASRTCPLRMTPNACGWPVGSK